MPLELVPVGAVAGDTGDCLTGGAGTATAQRLAQVGVNTRKILGF